MAGLTIATRLCAHDYVRTQGKCYVLSVNKEVTLFAGVVGRPRVFVRCDHPLTKLQFPSLQLLMVYGIGPKATLDRMNITVIPERPSVGQNM